MAEEIDVIQHLIEVEKEAALVIHEAQDEADSRIAAARAKADAEFKAQYSVMYEQLEGEAKEKMANAKSAHDTAISQYKQSLESTPKNKEAFSALMDSLLFK